MAKGKLSHPICMMVDMRSFPDLGLVIDCDTCLMQDTDACTDCVVTYLCDREPTDAVIIPIEQLRSLRTLSEAGLVPQLRHTAAVASGGSGATMGEWPPPPSPI